MFSINTYSLALAVPALIFLAHFVPWIVDPHGIRSYPGPFLAKFSNLWLAYVSNMGHRSVTIHKMHQKYGPIVRLAPNYVSIADADALHPIYGHGNGALKSDSYDAFVSIRPGLFSTRDRADHTRKRKMVSNVFSPKNVLEFEPYLTRYISRLVEKWDQLYDLARKGMSGDDGEGGWEGKNGRLYLDALPWVNYLAFDIIGDLAFGAPFGMLEAAKDIAIVPKHSDHQAVMDSYGKQEINPELVGVPAIQLLSRRGEHSMCMGVLPPYWRPLVSRLPGYRHGNESVKDLAGMAIMAVAKRLANPSSRADLLNKLQIGRDAEGKPMGKEELTAEAQTFLIAGSDTTSNTLGAIIYHVVSNPYIVEKLQKELDEQLGAEDDLVATVDQVKGLPYLNACINEGLRVHSTSSLGLPREVPKGGLTAMGQYFAEGTVVGVPSYSIHRDVSVWGEDVDVYRPERWFQCDQHAIHKTFNPWSYGPRACIGRSLAMMEMQIFLATLFRRYSIVPERPDQVLEIREGFIRKPLACRVGIKRRD